MLYLRHLSLPMAFAIGSVVFAADVFAAPDVEERSAGGGGSASAGGDLSVVVFEQFQQFQSQVEALTGRVEQLEHELKVAREQEKARYVDLDARVGSVEKSVEAAAKAAEQAVKAQAAAAETGDKPAAGPAGTVTEGDEQSLFDAGLALVKEKKYDDAITAFEQQLKRFPRGELAPTAMYWLGEMWRVASTPDLPKAGRYFYRVYNEYPKSSRASAAMYLHGLLTCQEDPAKGRAILNRVLINHPSSKDAGLAENALKNQCQ